jgi:hypothetical protein
VRKVQLSQMIVTCVTGWECGRKSPGVQGCFDSVSTASQSRGRLVIGQNVKRLGERSRRRWFHREVPAGSSPAEQALQLLATGFRIRRESKSPASVPVAARCSYMYGVCASGREQRPRTGYKRMISYQHRKRAVQNVKRFVFAVMDVRRRSILRKSNEFDDCGYQSRIHH